MGSVSYKQSFISFLQSRLSELLGLGLLVFGLSLGASLFTYSPSDPSWNVAVESTPQNILGGYGATISDMSFQLFGFTSYLLALFCLSFGIFLFMRSKKFERSLRILLFLLSLACLLTAFSFWEMGGVFGSLMLQQVRLIPFSPLVLCLLFLGIGLPLFLLSIGVSFAHLKALTSFLHRSIPAPKAKSRKEEPVFEDDFEEWPEEEKDIPKDKSIKIMDYVKPKPVKTTPKRATPTPRMKPSEPFSLPPLDLLNQPASSAQTMRVTEGELQENAEALEAVLNDYGIRGEIVGVYPGPVVTLYELEPAPGLKSSRVIGLADDIARSMSAVSARVAVIPGKNVIGIELPNPVRETVNLRDLLSSSEYEKSKAHLTLILGKDIGGTPIIADLARMPHLLVAGTTGSGKSVAVNAMILSLIYHLPPERCKFIMIDPKMLELSIYDGIPHLLAPVVTEPKKAIVALKWVVREMESRYQSMSKLSVRNIEGYNQRVLQAKAKGEIITRRVQTGFDSETGKPIFEDQALPMKPLPFIVVVVDEMADLMLVAGKDIEAAVQRLAQMARAAGIHLIMATQRPSVDVITGTIKANFPTRISFQVTSKIDSRTILGEQGAEQLLGQGDMLYMAAGGRISRVHGPYVGDADVEKVVHFLKTQGNGPAYVEDITVDPMAPELPFGSDGDSEEDALYDQALAIVYRENKASTSFIQRHLKIGYNRAARLIEKMEEDGIVSSPNHVGKREILARQTPSDEGNAA